MKSIETEKITPQETITSALSEKILEAEGRARLFHYASLALGAVAAAGCGVLLIKGTALGIVIGMAATAGLVPVYARKKYWESRVEAHRETRSMIASRSIDMLQETYALLHDFNRSSVPQVNVADMVKLNAPDIAQPIGAANQNYLIKKPSSTSSKKPPQKP